MKLPFTYFLGYPLVIFGFFGELWGLYHTNPLAGIGIMVGSAVVLFVGCVCFFHALLTMRKRNDPAAATTGREA